MDDDGALVDVGFALALIRLVTVEPIHSHIVSLSPKAFENFLPSFFKHLFFIRETWEVGFCVGKDIVFRFIIEV